MMFLLVSFKANLETDGLNNKRDKHIRPLGGRWAACHATCQVALQVSLPEIDGAIEPLIFSGRDGTSGRSIPMQDPVPFGG